MTTVMRAEQGRSAVLAAIGLAGAYGTTAGALPGGPAVTKTEGRV